MNKGDYVVATKYSDGDPGDHFCVGYLTETYDHYGQTRFIVVDADGKPFRANGFRRCEPITEPQGRWLIDHFPEIEMHKLVFDDDGNHTGGRSVWEWVAEAREKRGG